MTSTMVSVRRHQKVTQRPNGTALTPAAITLIIVGATAAGGWLWSRSTQPGVDAQTLARLQRRQPMQRGA